MHQAWEWIERSLVHNSARRAASIFSYTEAGGRADSLDFVLEIIDARVLHREELGAHQQGGTLTVQLELNFCK